MPNLVVRITDTEMAALEAAASRAGQSRSDYVRETLTLRDSAPDLATQADDLARRADGFDKRLSALEALARMRREMLESYAPTTELPETRTGVKGTVVDGDAW